MADEDTADVSLQQQAGAEHMRTIEALLAENERLRSQLKAANLDADLNGERAEAAEAELATLRPENEWLRTRLDNAWSRLVSAEAESERLRVKLSNANSYARLSTRDAKHAESRIEEAIQRLTYDEELLPETRIERALEALRAR